MLSVWNNEIESEVCKMDLNTYSKEYRGDGEKSYLSISVPVNETVKQYQIGMLEKNHIEILLPLYTQRINDDLKLSWEITSRIPLDRILQRKVLKQNEFEHFIVQFVNLTNVLKDYLLDLSSVVLDKSHIYCDPSSLSLYFLYLPMNSNEKEPDRIKAFLKKLIVEDIRLLEDVSGSLLKKLLEVLKSESFSVEQLIYCVEAKKAEKEINPVVSDEAIVHQEYPEGLADYQYHQNQGNNLNHRGIHHDRSIHKHQHVQQHQSQNQGLHHYEHQRQSQSHNQNHNHNHNHNHNQNQIKNQNQINCQSKWQIPHHANSNKVPGNEYRQKDDQHANHGEKTGQGLSLYEKMKLYPQSSWLITGAVNITFLGIITFILLSSGKNSGKLASTLAGFLLIAAASNYFLITRLFSKDRIREYENTTVQPMKSIGKKEKMFIEKVEEEDIILPGKKSIYAKASTLYENATSDAKWFDTQSQCKLSANSQLYSTKSKTTAMYDESAAMNPKYPLVNDISESPAMEQNSILTYKSNQIDNLPNVSTVEKPPIDENDGLHALSAFNTGNMKKKPAILDKTVLLCGESTLHFSCLQSRSCPSEKIIIEKDSMLLGRLKDSVDYVIQNKAIGKIHAEIIKKDESYFIIDLNSVNGTYVNDKRILCNTETRVNNGDRVTLANEAYTFIQCT